MHFAAPSDLLAIAQSETEISLDWNDNADDETAYKVERSEDGGNTWTEIVGLGAGASAHSDQGLEAGTYCLYRARALGDGGPSRYSNEAGATTDEATPPPPPPADCSVSGASTVKLDDKKFYWKITNDGGIGVTIDRVDISWPSAQGKLKKLRLGRDEIWRGGIASGPATVDSRWNTNQSRRQMNAGETEEFRAEFKSKYKNDKPSDYSVTVHFAEGCSVQF